MAQTNENDTGSGTGGNVGGDEKETGAVVVTNGRNGDGINADASDLDIGALSATESRNSGDVGVRADVAIASDATAGQPRSGQEGPPSPSSLPGIAAGKKETTTSTPPQSVVEAAASIGAVNSPGGNRGSGSEIKKAAGTSEFDSNADEGILSVGVNSRSGGSDSDSGRGNAATAGAIGNEAASHASAASFFDKHAEEHLSCKYTKQELMARHWGMSLTQMKRVKALLRMGVCEEDLVIADRLLKMGRWAGGGRRRLRSESELAYAGRRGLLRGLCF